MFLHLVAVTEVGKRSGQIIEIFDLVADTIFDILPALQFILLFFTFASVRGGEFIFNNDLSSSVFVLFRVQINTFFSNAIVKHLAFTETDIPKDLPELAVNLLSYNTQH